MSSDQDQVAERRRDNAGSVEGRSSSSVISDDDSSCTSSSSSGWDKEESDKQNDHLPSSDNPSISSSSHTHFSFAEHHHRFRERGSSSVDGESLHQGTTPPTSPPRPQHQQQPVPEDQERQILLLMLLAQVCALHDPTPRTFTVHVLELFERGILDRQSIHFLYDLGLVPTSRPPLLLTASPAAAAAQTTTEELMAVIPAGGAKNATKNLLRQRSMEASAIRSRLEHHEKLLHSHSDSETAAADHRNNNSSRQQQQQQPPPSWSVEEHPLSLSRYQREFEQIGLLASGSFGQVFQACSKMDGREYAIKRVPFAATGYSRDSVQTVVREVHCLAVCDHPNVVRYYTSWLEPSWMTGSPTITDNNNNNSSNSDRRHLKLLTDLQHMIRGEGSSEAISDDLKDYFKDPSFGVTHRRASSLDNFFDASASSWGSVDNNDDDVDVSEWTIDQSKDDIFVSGYRGSRRCQGRAQFQQETDDLDPWRQRQQNQQHKRKPEQTHYQYQICLFIQMQLCHPATLADWIRARNQTMSDQSLGDRLEIVAEIFDQIVAGLSHVHSKRIVHRDLKPSNVFASADGLHFKIGDFGLSKLIESAASQSVDSSPPRRSGRFQRQQQLLLLEHESKQCNRASACAATSSWHDPLTAGVGTASYAAPEQVNTRTYGTGADIFSFGLILLELLCCFSTEHERLQTFHDCRHRRELPPEFKEYPLVAQTILACTDPMPGKRPTADDLTKINLRAESSCRHSNSSKDQDIESLKRQLAEKEKELQQCKTELEKKDCTINDLRREVERISATTKSGHSNYPTMSKRLDVDLSEPSPASSSNTEDDI